jgi:Protein RETICULATA-related
LVEHLQGFVFGLVGFGAGVVGTSVSNGLLMIRKRLDSHFTSQNEAPNVILNASTWGAHMAISSNLRYQILNGLDMVSHRRAIVVMDVSSCCDLLLEAWYVSVGIEPKSLCIPLVAHRWSNRCLALGCS